MKKTIFILISLISACATAQVAIGKSNTTNASVSLEFGDYDNSNGKGLILPWVTSASTLNTAVEGTLIFDTEDHILKYKNSDTEWFALTRNENAAVEGSTVDTTGAADTTLQDNLADNPNAKAVIGAAGETDTPPGILVLSDTDKAMILPKAPEPHKNISNPEPGTIVYDTTNKMVAVFNGTVWSFWKP